MVTRETSQVGSRLAARTYGRGSAPLIFVVGNSRSGTTMMGRILGLHPQVFTFDELHYFEQMWNPATEPGPLEPAAAEHLLTRLLAIHADGYLQRLDLAAHASQARDLARLMPQPITGSEVYAAFVRHACQEAGKRIGCDQTPRNLYYLPELLDLYPDARAVVMVRDPRDVLLSQKKRWRRRFSGIGTMRPFNIARTWAGYHPLTISLLWKSGMEATNRVRDHPRVVTVRFEDLLADPRSEVSRICDRLGLDFHGRMLGVPALGSSHRRDEPARLGVDPTAANRWRSGGLSRTELHLCQRVAGAHAESLGYPSVPIAPNRALVVTSVLAWGLKSVMAAATNVRRVRDVRETVRRRLGR